MVGDDIVARLLHARAPELLQYAPVPRKALFLDRDGVINVDHGYVHSPSETDFVPGIFDLVRSGWKAGYVPVVITNQAGIARGLYDEATFLDYTRWVHAQFDSQGTPIVATFFCPHHPTHGAGRYRVDCKCRKPQPGMLIAAADALHLDCSGSLMIGDKESDIIAARAAGVGQARLVRRCDELSEIRALLETEARR